MEHQKSKDLKLWEAINIGEQKTLAEYAGGEKKNGRTSNKNYK